MGSSSLALHMSKERKKPRALAKAVANRLKEKVTVKQIEALMAESNRGYIEKRRQGLEKTAVVGLDLHACSAIYHRLFVQQQVLPPLSETPEPERVVLTAAITFSLTTQLVPSSIRGKDRDLLAAIDSLLDEFKESALAEEVEGFDGGDADHTLLYEYRKNATGKTQADLGAAPRQSELESVRFWQKLPTISRRLTAACLEVCAGAGRALICFAERGVTPPLELAQVKRLALLCALVACPTPDRYGGHAYNLIVSIRHRALAWYERRLRLDGEGGL